MEFLTKSTKRKDFASKLEVFVDRMERALREDDLDAWAVADDDFHRAIVDLTGMRRLVALSHSLLNQSHRVRMFFLRLREKPNRSTDNHRRLVEAIRQGDLDAVASIHRGQKGKWLDEMSDLFAMLRISKL